MYKSIIPELVTIEANVKEVYGSYLFRDFTFFPPVKKRGQHHYKVVIKKKIDLPDTYDFRKGYYYKSGHSWFYDRSFFRISLRMEYNTKTKTFYSNKAFHLIRFGIGGILPLGKHIADVINIDLFEGGLDIVRGCAYQIGDVTSCIISPSFNGKTTLINSFMEKGASYIAEDILVMNLDKGIVYPTSALAKNYGRRNNISTYTKAKSLTLYKKQKITSLYLSMNSTNISAEYSNNESFLDYYILNSLLFLNNVFARAILFNGDLSEELVGRLGSLKKMKPKYEIQYIKGYNFYFKDLETRNNKSHWENIGSKYSDIWKNLERKQMSQNELNLIDNVLEETMPKTILDVGIGNGRILGNLLKHSNSNTKISGIDISMKMVNICKKDLVRTQKLLIYDN